MVNLERSAARAAPDAREPRREDGYLPIGEYAPIGDGRTLALVGSDGSIDWMCLPELDAPAVFAAILDAERGGYFALAPTARYAVQREYLPRTNVLQTTFVTDEGTVRVSDALTIDKSQVAPWRELARRIEALSGRVRMRWHLEPRFEFGKRAAEFKRYGAASVTRTAGMQVALQAWGAGDASSTGASVGGEFELSAGESALLALQATDEEPLPLPARDAVERRLDETVEVWSAWVARHCYEGPWTEAVERSLLAIRLLADGRSGAIAAAGTCSLPEVVGGKRNYDYRFGWVRDLSFTLDALLGVGMEQLTHGSLTWLLRATSHSHPRVDPVYALNGDVIRSQERLELAGYRRTAPVHVGNNAGAQLQLGGFGDLLETISIYVRHGHVLGPGTGERLADMADLLCLLWRNEDAGLWELGDSAQYTTSKVGCWVALDRTLELVEKGLVPPRHVERWRRERDAMRDFIETRLWSQERRRYVFKAGTDELDCGTLLMARREYLDPRGERMLATIDAINAELSAGGPLFYRYSGMQSEENAFLACSFWMVEAMALAGRVEPAAELMEGILALGNDLGLYSEEMDPSTHALLGNFPQALTHLALINAASIVTRCSE